jgi:hypothetical protein
VSGDRGTICIGVSPHRVQGHRCQSTEGSYVLVSSRSTDGIEIEVCQSTEGLWVDYRCKSTGVSCNTGVSLVRVHDCKCLSTEGLR